MFNFDPNMTKIHPKMLKIRQIAPQKIQNVNKLLQKFYSRQKTRELPSKSYCWTSNLLDTSCLGAATICSSARVHYYYFVRLMFKLFYRSEMFYKESPWTEIKTVKI